MTVATLVTGGSVMVFLTVSIIVSYPEVAVLPIAIGGAAIALLMPILTYPFTHTLWSAFDLAVHPPERNEFTEATPPHLLPPERSGAEAERARSNWSSGPR
jgi:hypothetical protein